MDFSVPRNLKHQPLMVVEDYEDIDGYFAGDSDAKGLSLGLAQWNPEEISVKVWRYSGSKWSRQSEELPLHRNLDLTILLLIAFTAVNNPASLKGLVSTKIEREYNTTIVRNGNYKIKLTLERPERAKEFITQHYESYYKDRLKVISDLLNVLGV